MTRENKKLLLQYLSAALFYKVVVDYAHNAFDVHNGNYIKYGSKCILNCYLLDIFISPRQNEKGEYINPYLRPMSSMTEEERKELSKRYNWRINGVIQIRHHSDGYWDDDTECSTEDYLWLFTWLLKNHFDFMGLIPKGLALEAPEDMYKKEE